jgi:hypothetical protein
LEPGPSDPHAAVLAERRCVGDGLVNITDLGDRKLKFLEHDTVPGRLNGHGIRADAAREPEHDQEKGYDYVSEGAHDWSLVPSEDWLADPFISHVYATMGSAVQMKLIPARPAWQQ